MMYYDCTNLQWEHPTFFRLRPMSRIHLENKLDYSKNLFLSGATERSTLRQAQRNTVLEATKNM